MRKNLAVLVGTAVISAGMFFGGAGIASAASTNQTMPGTPGTANCVGQTKAYLAQFGTTEGVTGIGNVASTVGLSVQQINAIVDAYCAG